MSKHITVKTVKTIEINDDFLAELQLLATQISANLETPDRTYSRAALYRHVTTAIEEAFNLGKENSDAR